MSKKEKLISYSPINNQEIAYSPEVTTDKEYEEIVQRSQKEFLRWRQVPAPERGQLIYEVGEAFRKRKNELGELISLEVGKVLAEGKGEVQEIIDICDFAVGLSRQLYGKTMHSERREHRMYEQWHPLGVVGVITAFNFPAAVWGWNAMIGAVCGNTILWKPSELAVGTAVLTQEIASEIAKKWGFPDLFSVVYSKGKEIGEKIAEDQRIALVSATGSCAMGKSVAQTVGKRLGKYLLELGGNNAVIVLDDADIELVLRAVAFGAAGTSGQRCTTTRRLIVQRGISDKLLTRLTSTYKQIKIGDPRKDGILMGPLINKRAVESYEKAIKEAMKEGGMILCGGNKLSAMPSELYVEPTIIKATRKMKIVKEETFAPILYVIEVDTLEEAIEINNEVVQGLSSAIFTRSLQSAELFLSCCGSDCGIANVNLGTSGAEIGGAFGGEKETGGGRESGSDSWKQYMRRQTNTINYGDKLPLAQGINWEA